MKRINVTQSFLPPFNEYVEQIKSIWESKQLTNKGRISQQLQEKLKKYLSVKHLEYVSNGTIAIQVSIDALGITEGEIITTPFSFIATAGSIIWQRCKPIFVDIRTDTFNIDETKIEEKITSKTKAILPVHVFGVPCDVESIEAISKKYNLPVIYDAAHAFGVKYKDRSLLSYGDISTCSFHATKLFQTAEGGAIISQDPKVARCVALKMKFGLENEEQFMYGINAKVSEFNAAMGLCNIKYISEIIESRKRVCEKYDECLENKLGRHTIPPDTEWNYSYYPVLFENENVLLQVVSALNAEEIYPRRYFYPSLNTIDYMKGDACPISEDISKRILCLPLFTELSDDDIIRISRIILKNI